MDEGVGGAAGLYWARCIAEYQGVCSCILYITGCRSPSKAVYGVVDMIPQACGVSMTALVTGQACWLPPKSPWSGVHVDFSTTVYAAGIDGYYQELCIYTKRPIENTES